MDIIKYIDRSGWINPIKLESINDIQEFIDEFEKKENKIKKNYFDDKKFFFFKYIFSELQSSKSYLDTLNTNFLNNNNNINKNIIFSKLNNNDLFDNILLKLINLREEIKLIKKNNKINDIDEIFNNDYTSLDISKRPLLIKCYFNYLHESNITANQNLNNEYNNINKDIEKIKNEYKNHDSLIEFPALTMSLPQIQQLVQQNIINKTKNKLNKEISYSLNNIICSNRINMKTTGIPLKYFKQIFISQLNSFISSSSMNTENFENINFFFKNYNIDKTIDDILFINSDNNNTQFLIPTFTNKDGNTINLKDLKTIEAYKNINKIEINDANLNIEIIYILQLLLNYSSSSDKKVDLDINNHTKGKVNISFIIKYLFYSIIYKILIENLKNIFGNLNNNTKIDEIHKNYVGYFKTKLVEYFINNHKLIKQVYTFNDQYKIEEFHENTVDKLYKYNKLFNSRNIYILDEEGSKYSVNKDGINNLFKGIFIDNKNTIDLYRPYKKKRNLYLGGPIQNKTKKITINIYNNFLEEKYIQNHKAKDEIYYLLTKIFTKKANYIFIKELYLYFKNNLFDSLTRPFIKFNELKLQIKLKYNIIRKKLIKYNLDLLKISKSKINNDISSQIKNLSKTYLNIKIDQIKVKCKTFRILLKIFMENDNNISDKFNIVDESLDDIDSEIKHKISINIKNFLNKQNKSNNNSKNKSNNNSNNNTSLLSLLNNENNKKINTSNLNTNEFNLFKSIKLYFKNKNILIPFYFKSNNKFQYGIFDISNFINNNLIFKNEQLKLDDQITTKIFNAYLKKNYMFLVTKLIKNINDISTWKCINYQYIKNLKKKDFFKKFDFIKNIIINNYDKYFNKSWPIKNTDSNVMYLLLNTNNPKYCISFNNIRNKIIKK